MIKAFLTLTTITVLGLGVTGCADVIDKPVGTYKSSTTTKSPSGTKTTTDKTTYVYTDEHGDKKMTEKVETTKDPKGMFNKTTSTSVKTYN